MTEPVQLEKDLRKVTRSQVSKNCTTIADIAKKSAFSVDDIDTLQSKKLNLLQFKDDLKEFNKVISPTVQDARFEKEMEEVADYFDKINLHIVKVDRIICEFNSRSTILSQSSFSSNSPGRSILSVSTAASALSSTSQQQLPTGGQTFDPEVRVFGSRSVFKLPTLEIEQFKGEHANWPSFWGQFQNAVGRYEDIPNSDKLQYLKSLLRGPPLEMIRPLQIIDENYSVAVELLTERYDQGETEMLLHFQAICKLNPIESAKNLEAIRRLEGAVSIHVNALLKTSVSPELIFKNVEKLFPFKFIRGFLENPNEPKTIVDLLRFIRKEINFREKWKLSHSVEQASPRSPPSRRQVGVDQIRENLTTTSMLFSSDKNVQRKPSYCLFCDIKGHWGRECMARLSLKTKREILNLRSRCLLCFKSAHIARECTFPYRLCERCGGRHFVAVCPKHPYAEVVDEVGEDEVVNTLAVAQVDETMSCDDDDQDYASVAVNFVAEDKRTTILMQTAEVSIVSNQGEVKIICLLDSGSQRSFLIQGVADELKLDKTCMETLLIEGFAAQSTTGEFPRVSFMVKGLTGNMEIQMEALVVPQLTNYRPQPGSKMIESALRKLNNMGLSAADTRKQIRPRRIQLIIGADFLNKIVTGKSIKINQQLMAYETTFGWTLQGQTFLDDKSELFRQTVCSFVHVMEPPEDLNRILKKFWELEAIGIKEDVKENFVEVHRDFRKDLQFNGHCYSVALPWISKQKYLLDSNRNLALARFQSIFRRLQHDDKLFTLYHDAIATYENEGHAEVVDEMMEVSVDNPIYYLPHHPVIDDSRSTKIRIVFDASAHGNQEISLNDCLFQGYDLSIDVVKLLLKFRSGPIACVADVRKAFLQIEVNERDRDALRYFWINPALPKNLMASYPRVLRMKKVPFGMVSSPYLLHQTIVEHCARLEKDNRVSTGAVTALLNGLYVDDIILEGETTMEVDELFEEINMMMKTAGFTLHKIVRNDKVNESISTKVLGMQWHLQKDEISINEVDISKFPTQTVTKREVIKFSSMIFDPLGLLSPVTLVARYIFQETWRHKIKWDDDISPQLLAKWNRWLMSLKTNLPIKHPRHLVTGSIGSVLKNKQFQLHIFADASPKAYGAVAYVVYKSKIGQWECNLLMSKFKVAPITMDKIPRLELMAATVAAKLSEYLQCIFWNPASLTYWSDSTVVLGWLKRIPRKVGSFVVNRVLQIRKLTSISDWKHCPGDLNPADIATRPHIDEPFVRHNEWFHGPDWLRRDPQEPPNAETEFGCVEEELVFVNLVCALTMSVVKPTSDIASLIDINRFSDYYKLIRVTCMVLSARSRFRSLNCTDDQLMDEAELLWLYAVQGEAFQLERSILQEGKQTFIKQVSMLRNLKPLLDENDLIRLQGRFQGSSLSYDERHPIILPPKHRWTWLFIDYTHRQLKHAGVSTTLTVVRQRFWIITGRKVCRQVIAKCIICKRFLNKVVKQPVAPLPEVRTSLVNPFDCVGVDFAGPALIKAWPGGPIEKAYIALFTCASSRAIHLELVSSLSAKSFMMALRRFIGRRGAPSIIYSDNALQFKKAEKELQQLDRVCHTDEVQTFVTERKIEWRFIVERAPWWGGFWERLVKSVKEPLRRSVGNALLTFEELETTLIEIEAIINSRPLASLFEDVDDLQILTPAHLLLGKPLIHLQPKVRVKGDISLPTLHYTDRLKKKNEFLRRWKESYLLQLMSAHNTSGVNGVELTQGMVVLLKEDNKPRHKWKLCRILDVKRGRDGLIRSCQLKTAQGQLLRRPVDLIVVLEDTVFFPPGIVASPDEEIATVSVSGAD